MALGVSPEYKHKISVSATGPFLGGLKQSHPGLRRVRVVRASRLRLGPTH